jgi:hypothetical protein
LFFEKNHESGKGKPTLARFGKKYQEPAENGRWRERIMRIGKKEDDLTRRVSLEEVIGIAEELFRLFKKLFALQAKSDRAFRHLMRRHPGWTRDEGMNPEAWAWEARGIEIGKFISEKIHPFVESRGGVVLGACDAVFLASDRRGMSYRIPHYLRDGKTNNAGLQIWCHRRGWRPICGKDRGFNIRERQIISLPLSPLPRPQPRKTSSGGSLPSPRQCFGRKGGWKK